MHTFEVSDEVRRDRQLALDVLATGRALSLDQVTIAFEPRQPEEGSGDDQWKLASSPAVGDAVRSVGVPLLHLVTGELLITDIADNGSRVLYGGRGQLGLDVKV